MTARRGNPDLRPGAGDEAAALVVSQERARRPSARGAAGASGAPRLPTQVAHLLGQQILEGRLRPGDQLPTELRLAERYGVSRTVIREAVARLRSDGVVETRHGIGAFVSEPRGGGALRIAPASLDDRQRFAELFEVRSLLEIEAAAIAASRRTTAQLAAILEAHRRLDQAPGESVAMLDADLDFHRAITKATGNGYLPVLIGFLSRQLRQSIIASWAGGDGTGAHDLTVQEHAEIARAIEKGDPAAARAAATAHIRNAARRLGLESLPPLSADCDKARPQRRG
jgi:DNA-binding FadR family transcriptional regulator